MLRSSISFTFLLVICFLIEADEAAIARQNNGNSISIRAFKMNTTAKKLIQEIEKSGRDIRITEVPLKGGCGFAGCSWKHLIVLESRDPPSSSHSYSNTAMAVVSGFAPKNEDISVRFVELKIIPDLAVEPL